MRVTLIDDEIDALDLIKEYLAEIPQVTEVETFSNAKKALKATLASPPDLVLLDINMPELDGISFADQLLDLDVPPKIIFITAYGQYAIQAFELNAIDYLLKPVNFDRFHKAILRFIEIDKKYDKKIPVALDQTVTIRCFGQLQIEGNGQQIKFNTSKVEELFVYLWLHKERSIDRIMYDIFPDFDEERAKQYLHTCIYQLKKAFKTAGLMNAIDIKNDRKMYKLQLVKGQDDQEDFVSKYFEAISTDKVGLYLKAISIYEGEFIENLDSAWTISFREKFARMYALLLEKLVQLLLQDNQSEIALYFVNQLVETHPLVSTYTLLHIQALLLVGSKEEAQMVYRDFRNQWMKEFNEEIPAGFKESCEALGVVN